MLRLPAASLIILVIFFTSMTEVYGQNQCLVSKQNSSFTPSDEEKQKLDQCIKDKSCRQKDFGLICPWAFDRKKNPKPGTSKLEQDRIDTICEQCEQVSIISCSLDLKAGLSILEFMSNTFLSANNSGNPLIYGYKFPDYRYNNLNLTDNIRKIEADNLVYQSELAALTQRLNALSKGVTNEASASRNLTTTRRLIEAFQKKWDGYYKDVDQLEAFISRVKNISDDWLAKVTNLLQDPSCAVIQADFQKALTDGSIFGQQVTESTKKLQKIRLKKRVEDLRSFTETAIKLAYTKATGSKLETLEQAIGAVFGLEAEMSRANEWWFKVSSNGLANGQHTRLFMWQPALRTLQMQLAEGQAFIEKFKKYNRAPANAVQQAISSQQSRLDLIISDIEWLKSRGWQGQLESQRATVKEWLLALGNNNTVCSAALKKYQIASKAVLDELQFEKLTEAEFVPTIQVCEAQ